MRSQSAQLKHTMGKGAQVVLITGATSGFGQITARHLTAQGYRVFGTGRQPVPNHTEGYTMLTLDVRDDHSVQTCVDAVIQQAGRIDVLINNAGYVGPFAASEETEMEQLRALFETNFFGTVRMTNAVLPNMRRQHSGLIINISSAAGLVGVPQFGSGYVSSKHAIEGYSGVLRLEMAPFNIRVALIEPGYFKTNIGQTIEPPAKPLADYAIARQRSAAIERFAVEHGDNPLKVARLVQRIIEQKQPALHHPISFEAQTSYWFSRPMPGLYERLSRWLYGGTINYPGRDSSRHAITNDATNEPTGLRRYMFDKTGKNAWAAQLTKAATFVAPIGVALIIASIVIGRRKR